MDEPRSRTARSPPGRPLAEPAAAPAAATAESELQGGAKPRRQRPGAIQIPGESARTQGRQDSPQGQTPDRATAAWLRLPPSPARLRAVSRPLAQAPPTDRELIAEGKRVLWDDERELRDVQRRCPGPPGALSALSISHSKSGLYGTFCMGAQGT
jgi:hypothetical protein